MRYGNSMRRLYRQYRKTARKKEFIMLTERELKESVEEQTFYRGKLIESTSGVLSYEEYLTNGINGEPILELRSTIKGSNRKKYGVEIDLQLDGGFDSTGRYEGEYDIQHMEYYCNCKAFETYDGMCKHCVATLLHSIYNWDVDFIIHDNILDEEYGFAERDDTGNGSVFSNSYDTDGKEYYQKYDTGENHRYANGYDTGERHGYADGYNIEDEEYFEKNYGLPLTDLSETRRNSAGLQSEMPPARQTDNGMKQLLRKFGQKENWLITDGGLRGKIHLEPILHFGSKGATVSLKIGQDKMYVVKDIYSLVRDTKNMEWHSYGKNLAFTHQIEAFDRESRPLLEFFMRQYEAYEYWYGITVREFVLGYDVVDGFIDAIRECGVYLDRADKTEKRWYPTEETYQKKLCITAQKGGGVLLHLEQVPFACSRDWEYIFADHKIYKVSRRDQQILNTFEKHMNGWWNGECFISETDLPLFSREMLPVLEQKYNVVKEDYYPEQYLPEEASFRLYLDLPQRDMITCDLVAAYNDGREYHVFRNHQGSGEKRNMRQEAKMAAVVSGYCNAYDEKNGVQAATGDDGCMYELLTQGLEEFEQLAEVYISDRLKKIQVRPQPKVTVGVALKSDLLEFEIDSEDMSLEQLSFLLSKYDRKKKFYRLKSGEFVSMEDGSLETLAQLKQGLHLSEEQLAAGKVMLPKFRALYLDAQLREEEGLSIERGKSFRELIRNMKTVEDSDFEVPQNYVKVLREYQKKGYFWLETLYNNGFGGILADDMGLGKTLQVITFLYAHYVERQETDRHALIICPASLVYNWEHECQQFAPELPVQVIAGTAAQRRALIENQTQGTVFITSYDLLRRDVERYQQMQFAYQIIDEAQYIKNAATKAAQAVKQINSVFRVALTGTPVENRLGELWSIFDYLMPGYLYEYEQFREELEIPVLQQDEKALSRLRKMIAPFILRRLKKDVLKDLPDKLEKPVYANMNGEQQELYQAHVQRLQLLIAEKSGEEFDRFKIQILAELTKLRQLCCDPALLYEDYKAGSAKLDLCVELVENAREAGHKMLIFSQFTTMLDRIAARLQKEKISYYMLTGATPKQERMRLVNTFNEDETSVFLISLKAGGTGLNLTAADTVIHYDPWWNTAVQNQATDRAHRIGQKNRVLVYKLIAKGSIEEKIIKLQEQKAQLAEQILGGEGVSGFSFSREELLELLENH